MNLRDRVLMNLNQETTVLTIGKVEDFRSLVVNLITAKTSTSADDKDIVATY